MSVPFAESLAGRILPVAVRLRRDFPAVLSLVRADALLHRATRELDGHGRITATLEDYAATRRLVLDLVSQAAERAVPATVRETVAVVAQLTRTQSEGVTILMVA